MNADSADRRPISTGILEIPTIWQPCQPFEAAQVGFAGTPRESPPQAGQTKKPRRLLAKCRPEENPRSRVIFPQFSLGNYHLNILERFASDGRYKHASTVVPSIHPPGRSFRRWVLSPGVFRVFNYLQFQ